MRVHGIPPCARSSKRAGGLIPRIALDQCRVPERYRTRVPFRTPEREVDRAAQPFHFFIEILESAGCESVEETGQGFFLSTEYWSTGALECCKVLRVIHITPLLHYSSTTVSYRGCGSTAECGRAKAETTVRFRSPAPVFWGRSSSVEISFDVREATRSALLLPHHFEGTALMKQDCLERLRKASGGQRKTGRRLAIRGQEQ